MRREIQAARIELGGNVYEWWHGDAIGVDKTADQALRELEVPDNQIIKCKPDFSNGYDVSQYHRRNREIVNTVNLMLIFWNSFSKGTESVIKYCYEVKRDYRLFFDTPITRF